MKKLLSLCISLILLFGIIPLGNNYPSIVFSRVEKKNATFIAVTWKKAGYDRDGTKLDPERYFPWEYTKGSSWGRKEVGMQGVPVYWTEFYLTIKGDGGKSKPENRWVAVIDSWGRMWIDPDGNFHNANYDKFSDPNHPAYIPGRCEGNPRAQVDPVSNTQGPYILDTTDNEFKPEIYFYDKLTTGRGFRIGWADMVDYPAYGTTLPDGTISDGSVKDGDWDIDFPLEKFVNNGDDIADEKEEWHLETVRENGYYDLGEAIYRLSVRSEATTDPIRSTVHEGDLRLTNVSVAYGEKIYNYYAGSQVQPSDKDLGLKIVPFMDDGSPVIDVGEEWHTTNFNPNGTYDPGESIYLKINGFPLPSVQVGDTRLTNVNTRTDERGLVNAGIYAGDVLILSEVLEANCDGSNIYDLSVETDLWMNVNPSVTTARIFSPNGELNYDAQRIQKSTVLDPDGKTFYVPATTFSGVDLSYREYIGVQLFADNGFDTNLCANLPTDRLYPQNLSDDYIAGRTGEEFLGAVSGNYAFDYGRYLTSFDGRDFYHDVGGEGFGCGESIYRKIKFAPGFEPDPLLNYVVEEGDIRYNTVTVEKEGNRVTYLPRTLVTTGDLDIGLAITPMPKDIKFFDEERFGSTNEYDEGETLYKSADDITGPGDIRFSEIKFAGKTYNCNSELASTDFWLRESPLHMISIGNCGDGKFIDMIVLPGKLDLDIQIDKPFKVEQTTQINAKLNTPLKDGEKVHLVVKEPEITGFGGVPAPPGRYQEQLLPHQWLPIWPGLEEDSEKKFLDNYMNITLPEIKQTFGEDFTPTFVDDGKGIPNLYVPKEEGGGELIPPKPKSKLTSSMPPGAPGGGVNPLADPMVEYRLNPYPYDYRMYYYSAWENFVTPPGAGRWSDPTVCLNQYSYVNQYCSNPYSYNYYYRYEKSPACAPQRGPYPYDFPVVGGRAFKFPFYGNNYSTIWVHPFPAIWLYNDPVPHRHPRQINTYMYYYYAGYGVAYPQYNYSNLPILSAYSDLYYAAISPARFTWKPPGSTCPDYPTAYSYYYVYDYPYTYLTHYGYYDQTQQPTSNGVWAYVDDSVSPRRLVITWIVNFSYDTYMNGMERTDIDIKYTPYRVQMVLYENGDFQYNYDGGNKYWSRYTGYGPVVGWTAKQGVGATANLLPHHMNRDLENAPSVKWSYYQPPGKIDPHDRWLPYVDYRELDNEHRDVTFQYTPYRGTCNEDGTRTRLEILAFLDKEGGIAQPVPLDPLQDVPFDKYDLPIGVANGNKAYVYVDMDSNAMITEGDIRLTSVTYGSSSYPQGSVVNATDSDATAPDDWKAYQPWNVPIGGAVYTDGTIIVYADLNSNGIADAGDVRLVAFGPYGQGTVVRAPYDWEVYNNQVLLFPADAPVGVIKDKYVYWDRDRSQTLTRFDIRLTAVDSYPAGTQVYAGDLDVGTPYARQNVPIGIHDPLPAEPFNKSIQYHTNVYAHLGDPAIALVAEGDIRISDCYIGPSGGPFTVYPKGTVVREGDPDIGDGFQIYNPKIYIIDNNYASGIYADVDNSGLNGCYNYYSAPTEGDIRITPNKWKRFYEYASFDPNYYRPKSFDAGTIVYTAYSEYSYPDHPWYEEFDVCGGPYYYYHYPYGAASWLNNISVTVDNKVYANVDPPSNFVKPRDWRITEIGKYFQGTYIEIYDGDRQSNFLYDPYWAIHAWTKLELDENPFKSVKPIPQVNPYPLIPKEVYNAYDCYSWFKYDIVAEDLILEADRKCIDLYEQRWPNIYLRIKDADNTNDVNDPANVVVSGNGNEPIVMNFNAHGGGIKFFFTAVAEPPSGQKYIGQYMEDDTVVFWYWYDNVPYGALDPNDFLSSGYDCNRGGAFKPVGSNPRGNYNKDFPPFPARVWDTDCTFGQTVCSICGDQPGFPKLGEIFNRFYYFAFDSGDINGRSIWNMGDQIINQLGAAPSFDGNTTDPQIIYCPSQGDGGCGTYCSPRRYGSVWTYGVPVQVTSWTDEDEGGRVCVPIKAFKAEPVTVRLYSSRVLYDYNTKYPHGPAFIHDTAHGIDYCGTLDLKVLEPDPKLNFGEFEIVDHSLQNSKVNYTSGTDALSPKSYPTPMLHADYNPILEDYRKDFRTYPGGQTHTARIPNDESRAGFNSYSALWHDMYNKLGTEMFPFSDYGIYFILYDGMDQRIYWDPNVGLPSRNIKAITVEGPFMRPKIFERIGATGALTQSYKSSYPNNLPVQYDYSGKIVIDLTNYNLYSTYSPPDLTAIASPFSADRFMYKYRNQRLVESRKLWYYGRFTGAQVSEYMYDWLNATHMLHIIDEIIPITQGKLSITVELYDGTVKKYQDCCEEIYDDIPVHGLEIGTNVSNIAVDTDTKLEINLKEYDTKSYPPSEHIIPCSDALVLVWQDRGVKDASGKINGAGDGWITVPPRSSEYTSSHAQLNRWFDINNDGKVSYSQWETEIIGTYDIATNSWSSGVIDARTFNRNDGTYIFDLTAQNGALVDTIGTDFGGPVSQNNLPDHVIDDYELLNLNITAFKYGDDDNDRAFTPIYNISRPYEFSHEVYLAGHKALPVVPKTDLIVSSTPQPLTAGCVPELLEAGLPLTFNVLDAEGNPVDLSRGIKDASGDDKVIDDVIWNVLIKDPHPDNKEFYGSKAKLPQYYWVRTDLHNNDGTMINNLRMYSFPRKPFLPIEVDFSEKAEGKYVFKGFCANDEGTFDVYVDTPDRKHRGVVKVQVELPRVIYGVEHLLINPDYYKEHGIPVSDGVEPDFVMTAANMSLYGVIAEIRDAQDNLITGAASGQCAAGENLARFTPYNTKLDNFNYYQLQSPVGYYSYEMYGQYIRTWYYTVNSPYYSYYDAYGGLLTRYYNSILVPRQNTNIIFWIDGFRVYGRSSWTSSWSAWDAITYYNTTNWQWENGDWEIYPVFDLPPADNLRGWGRGAIYNSPHKGGYLFPDWGGQVIDGMLDYRDSFPINEYGQVGVNFGASDICYYGGLIGKNPYSNDLTFGDVGGGLWNFRKLPWYPGDIRYRYNQYLSDTSGWTNADGTFKLDWDAFPNHDVKVGRPIAQVINETTGVEVGRSLVDTNNYDLIYGKTNHLRVKLYPASTNYPDLMIQPGGTLILSDDVYFPDDLQRESKSENLIWATTVYNESSQETSAVLELTPTGSFRDVAQLKYWGFSADWNVSFRYRDRFGKVWDLADFDVIRALKVVAKTGKDLYAGEADTLIIYVYEVGTNKPVSDANVTVTGPGIKLEGETDKDGLVRFDILPKDKGVIEINVTHRSLGEGYTALTVKEAKESSEILFNVDPIPQTTKESKIKVSGSTMPGYKVTINDKQVNVTDDGKFEAEIDLVEGPNNVVIIVEDSLGRTAKKVLTIVKDTMGPTIFIDDIPQLIDVREYTLKGKIEENATLEVNGKKAIINGENWEITIPLNFGENKVLLVGKDQLGNETRKELVLTVYHKVEVKLTIGSKEVIVNGTPLSEPLQVEPYIKNGNTYVPIRVISEAFGAKVEWLSDVKGIVIEFMGKKIEMQVGSKKAIINGKAVELDTPPEITSGVTFVPIRFIADTLGAEVKWIAETREIIITILVY